jgi:transcriptional regulator with XRE-family HTH domain
MEIQELARITGVSRDTVRRFERGEYQMRPATLDKVRAAFEERGVAFTFTRDGRPLGIEDASAQTAPYTRAS